MNKKKIGSNTNYTPVTVAGNIGRANGDNRFVSSGQFGGGLNGCNCYFKGSLKDK